MEWDLPKDDDPLNHKVDRLGTNWNFNDDQGVTHMRNYMEREFKRDLDQAQSSVDAGKRKVEIVSAIIGDTAKTKAVDNLAANIQKNIDETKAYAESQIAKAEKREAAAKAAEDRLPITRGEHVRNLEDIRMKPKEAWGAPDRVRFLKGKGWISDGFIALNLKGAAGKFGQKALDKVTPASDAPMMGSDIDAIYKGDSGKVTLQPLGALSMTDAPNEKADLALFSTPKGDLIAVNAHRLRLVENIYGNNLTYRGKGPQESIAALKDGKPVAILMPYKTDASLVDIPTAKKTMAAGGYKENNGIQRRLDRGAVGDANGRGSESQGSNEGGGEGSTPLTQRTRNEGAEARTSGDAGLAETRGKYEKSEGDLQSGAGNAHPADTGTRPSEAGIDRNIQKNEQNKTKLTQLSKPGEVAR